MGDLVPRGDGSARARAASRLFGSLQRGRSSGVEARLVADTGNATVAGRVVRVLVFAWAERIVIVEVSRDEASITLDGLLRPTPQQPVRVVERLSGDETVSGIQGRFSFRALSPGPVSLLIADWAGPGKEIRTTWVPL